MSRARQLRHPQHRGDQDLVPAAPRFHLHFTPTYSSWLNLVEHWFAELTNRKLRRSAHRSVAELEADLTAWIAAWNDDPRRSCGPRPQTRSSTTSQDIFA
jgi:transposase